MITRWMVDHNLWQHSIHLFCSVCGFVCQAFSRSVITWEINRTYFESTDKLEDDCVHLLHTRKSGD